MPSISSRSMAREEQGVGDVLKPLALSRLQRREAPPLHEGESAGEGRLRIRDDPAIAVSDANLESEHQRPERILLERFLTPRAELLVSPFQVRGDPVGAVFAAAFQVIPEIADHELAQDEGR